MYAVEVTTELVAKPTVVEHASTVKTRVLQGKPGAIILAPSGAHGIAIQLSAGLSYIVPRSAIADVAHGLIPCVRFDPVPV